MTEIFTRFSFQGARISSEIVVCAVLIWLFVLWCAATSIWSQPFSQRQRYFWLAVIVCLPLVGLLAYLPFSFSREDLPHAFLMKHKGPDRPKKPRASSAGGSRA